jgi:hypothetical protein
MYLLFKIVLNCILGVILIYSGFSVLIFLIKGIGKRIRIEKDKSKVEEQNNLVFYVKEKDLIVVYVLGVIWTLFLLVLVISILSRTFGFNYFDFVTESKFVKFIFN